VEVEHSQWRWEDGGDFLGSETPVDGEIVPVCGDNGGLREEF
jgi:hypothetical protein